MALHMCCGSKVICSESGSLNLTFLKLQKLYTFVCQKVQSGLGSGSGKIIGARSNRIRIHNTVSQDYRNHISGRSKRLYEICLAH
jgi:hypothetical protein